MSLSGNLGFVPIEEVLRLLTRSHQNGAVDVTGIGLRGRVFVGTGGIDLATTYDSADLHHHLVRSGYADEGTLGRITAGETTLAAIAEGNPAMVELLREMTVESLYQITDRGEDFHVREGATTPYASPRSFDLEEVIEDAAERKRQWNKVSEIVPDLEQTLSFHRELGDREEITVKLEDWKVLSEIGSGASVREIADHLGTTEFWAAQVAARLIKNDLVRLGEPERVSAPPSGADEPAESITDDARYVEPRYVEEPVAAQFEVATDDDIPALAPVEAEDPVLPDDSWWQEPADNDDVADEPAALEGLDAPEARDADESAEAGVDAGGEHGEGVEEDTEAFLEKVFSKLDKPEADEDEGHGLLRRRRMGTLRDFSSDS